MSRRITLAEARRLAQRGQISQADMDRLEQSMRRLAPVPVEIKRVPLAEPIEFGVPMELFTENRLRAMNPYHRGRHVKEQRSWVALAWRCHMNGPDWHKDTKAMHTTGRVLATAGRFNPALPVIVTMTRIGRRMDEHDSLRAAFKHVCDEITVQLGLTNDDTPLVEWRYSQEPCAGRPPSIRIRVEARP